MKRFLITAIAVCCFGFLAGAQPRIYNENVTHDKDLVTLSFKIDADKGVPLRYKEVIMPYIYNGKDTLWFGTVEIFGKGKYKRERQEKYLAGDRRWELGDNQTLADGIYTYTSQVPVKKWMISAAIGVKRYMTGCNCGPENDDNLIKEVRLKENLTLYTEAVLVLERKPVTYTLSDVAPSWDFGQEELVVKFELGKADFDPYMYENRTTFARILDAVDRIHQNPRYRMEHIDIEGYASPDGGLLANYDLAARRARAMVDYIISNRPSYGLTPSDFRISTTGVNWRGLKDYIKKSDFKDKDWIIGIIDGDFTEERKIALLKGLDGGSVWRKLYREVFPHLRTSRFTGVYYGSARDDHAGEQINEANAMIRQGRYIDAYNHLLHLKGDIRAYNTIGVSLMMQGMYDEAMQWFELALQNGCPIAQKNINAINASLLKESEQRRRYEIYLKKYE